MKICYEMYRKIKILKNHKQETLKKKKKLHFKGLLVSLMLQAPSWIG